MLLSRAAARCRLCARLPPGLARAAAGPGAARCASAAPEREEEKRLEAWLSRCGYCSRSESKAFIKAGRVAVSGVVARTGSGRVRASEVSVDGEPLEAPHGCILLMNKPAGRVCSHASEEGPSVFELLPERLRRRTPALQTVGRLDKDTTGALLLTDDSALLHFLSSPKSLHQKVYRVGVEGADFPEAAAATFASSSIVLDGEPCAPALLRPTPGWPREAEVVLTEGRYHQVKRMVSALGGCRVARLHRVCFAGYGVEELAEGEFRFLDLDDVRRGAGRESTAGGSSA